MVWAAGDSFGDFYTECRTLGACDESIPYCSQFTTLTIAEFVQNHFLVDPEVPDHWAGWVITEGPEMTQTVRNGFRDKLRDSYWTIYYVASYPAKFSAAEKQYAQDLIPGYLASITDPIQALRAFRKLRPYLTQAQKQALREIARQRWPDAETA